MPVLANSASRILSLALLTILINKQGWIGLLVLLIPLIFLFYQNPKSGKQVVLLIKRLRWFILSILLLYFWFYPGTELIPFMGRFSPAIEGVNQAVLRITSLLVIVSYSVFLLQLTPRNEIISGIQWILFPLTYIGIDCTRFALRLGLVLSMVPEKTQVNILPDNNKNAANLIDRAALMFKEAEESSKVSDDYDISASVMKPAGFIDMLLPLVLFIWLICS